MSPAGLIHDLMLDPVFQDKQPDRFDPLVSLGVQAERQTATRSDLKSVR